MFLLVMACFGCSTPPEQAPTTASAPHTEYTRQPLPNLPITSIYRAEPAAETAFYDVLPARGESKGLLVMLPAGGEGVEALQAHVGLDRAAAADGWTVLMPSINWDGFDGTAAVSLLDQILVHYKQASGHSGPIYLGGLSMGGQVSVQYAIAAAQGLTYVTPDGIFILDTLLDYARMYDYTQRELQRGISQAGTQEALYIQHELETLTGGTPESHPEAYTALSIFSRDHPKGGNAQHLLETRLLLCSDLDVDWLLESRHRDLYDWNGIDMVAMANTLKILGHKQVEVHISQGQGVRPDGTRHPHSWSILTEEVLLDWLNAAEA